MNLVERIEQAVGGGAAALAALIETTEFPHVEGRSVTFLFRGPTRLAP